METKNGNLWSTAVAAEMSLIDLLSSLFSSWKKKQVGQYLDVFHRMC